MPKKDIYLILHNIRSLHNVGSIFRTSDAAGVKKIYLTGYTPTPLDKFGKIRPEIKKTALGAETTVEWQKYKDIGKLIAELKQRTDLDGHQGRSLIVGVEQSPKSINYKSFKFKPERPLAFIFGNEVRGLSKQILKKCDKIVEIPMAGKMVRQAHHLKNIHPEQHRGKESLNVSVAAGIILFSLI